MTRGDLEKSIKNHIEEFCNSKFDKEDRHNQTELLIEITNLVDIHVRAEVNKILNEEYGVEKKEEVANDWFAIKTGNNMTLRTWTKANGSVIYYDASRVPRGMRVQEYLKMTGDYYLDGEERPTIKAITPREDAYTGNVDYVPETEVKMTHPLKKWLK